MHRSARTGRAVSAKEAKSNPETTVKEGKSKDAVRLDWLLKNQNLLCSTGTWPNSKLWLWIEGRSKPLSRAAIDKAMAKAEKVK